MKYKREIIVGMSSAFILLGCGGGGSSDNTDNANVTQTPSTYIKGSVPGTLIEAFCIDGSYYKTNSIKVGTQHPFELKVPKDLECRLVMTTNETDPDPKKRIVTPIKFNNKTYLALKDSIDIGYVPLTTTGSGVQTPLNINISTTKAVIKDLQNDPLDVDKDGIPNLYEDEDNDGIPNKLDSDFHGSVNDIDGDGIDNEHDKDKNNDGTIDNTNITPFTLPTTYTPNNGRVLASSCFGCHGTNGKSTNGWDSLSAGEMNEETYEHPLMDAIGVGYTNSEVAAIANWLSTMPNSGDNENGDENENEGGDDD